MSAPVYLDDAGHLWSPDLNRLHEFAISIGMRRAWYQDHRHPHYDVMVVWRRRWALRSGAISVTQRELVRLMREA